MKKTLPILALLAAMMLWGSSFVVIKYGVQEMHPLVLLFGRMTVGLCCFLPFTATLKTSLVSLFRGPSLASGRLAMLLLMCLCEPCLYLACEVEALMYTSAVQASMISTTMPLMVALSAGLFLGEQLTARLLTGFALALAGAIWLGLAESGENPAAPHPLLGNLLEMIAMLCGAAGTLALKRLSKKISSFPLTALQTLSGILCFGPLLLWTALTKGIALPGLREMLVLLYLGVACNFGAYSLYNFGVSRIPASHASAFLNLIPVFAIALGMLFLDERLNLAQAFACVLVMVGVFLTRGQGKTAQARPVE